MRAWNGGVLLIVIGAALATRLPELGGYANHDEGVYEQTLMLMRRGLPLYREIYHNQGPLFLPGIYPFWEALGGTLTAGRSAVALESLVGVVGAWWAGTLLGGPLGGLIAGLVWVFSPLSLSQARSLQSESPAVAWSLLSVAAALAYMRTLHGRDLIIAGSALGLSLAMKPLTIATLAPVLLAVALATHLAAKARVKAAALVVGLSALVPLAAASVFGLFQVLERLVIYRSAPDWVMTALYGSETLKTSMRASNPSDLAGGWSIVLAGLRPDGSGVLVVALGGAALLLAFQRRAATVVLTWLIATAVLLSSHSPLLERHALAMLAPLVVLCAGCASSLASLRRSRTVQSIVGSVVALGCIAFYLTGVPELDRSTREALSPAKTGGPLREAAGVLNAITQPNDFVFTDHNYLAVLADRTTIPEMADLDDYRIRSNWITEGDAIAALELHAPRASAIWTGNSSYYARYFPGVLTWLIANHQMIWEGEGGEFLGLARGSQIDPAVLPGHRTIDAEFANGTKLRAVEFPGQVVLGRDLGVQLLWQIAQTPPPGTESRVAIVRRTGPTSWDIAAELTERFGESRVPRDAMRPGDLTAQLVRVRVPEGLAPGEYRVAVSLMQDLAINPPASPKPEDAPESSANAGIVNVIAAP